MAGLKILVLGATGPAGICLLRELLYRNHPTIAYVRNPAKIPTDLAANPLLEVIEGQMDDLEKLETAVSKSTTILSLLGPNKPSIPEPTPYPGYYSALFPLMRKHGVKRILAMGTISIYVPDDSWSLIRFLIVLLVRIIAPAGRRAVLAIARVFQEEAAGLDWTVFRIAAIPGGHNEESWKKGREDGALFTGYVGQPGWKVSIKRGLLARWLVDSAESGAMEWVGKMPAVSRSGMAKARAK